MHRQPEHVIQFLFAEMGTTGSVDGAGRLVIKGRFQQKQIENVLRRYIGWSLIFLLLINESNTRTQSRIRYLQNVQITRHTAYKGNTYFLYDL